MCTLFGQLSFLTFLRVKGGLDPSVNSLVFFNFFFANDHVVDQF